MEFEIRFYEKTDGTKPAKEFLNELDKPMRIKMVKMISLLRELGFNLREPYSKPIDDGIFELRAQVGNNISRILYFFVIGKKVVLTNGFIKKTQKTPQKEIELAKKYRKDFLKQ